MEKNFINSIKIQNCLLFISIIFIYNFFNVSNVFSQGDIFNKQNDKDEKKSIINTLKSDYIILNFIENKGQYPDSILYVCEYKGGWFYFLKDGFIISQIQSNLSPHLSKEFNQNDYSVKQHNYKINFLNYNNNSTIIPQKKIETKYNYFLNTEKNNINATCNAYKSILYKDIYPNIDIHFFVHNNQLKYDIIVNPNGNAKNIKFEYLGVDKIKLKHNELIYQTSLSEIKEKIPVSYLIDDYNNKEEVKIKYKLDSNILSFIFDAYPSNYTLTIDPALIFASFSGSTTDNWGFTATYGYDGSFYLGGIVFRTGFNATVGSFQTNYGGNSASSPNKFYGSTTCDIVITKFSSDGTSLLYATYLGGSGDDLPNSLIEDSKGNLIILGRSNSNTNFPNINKSTLGVLGNTDILITKLNSTGNSIIKTWLIGGSGDDGVNMFVQYGQQRQQETNRFYSDMSRSEVIIDGQDNIYVATQTKSTNFPVSSNAFQSTNGGGQDGVFIKISSDMSSILCSSYLGGSATDAAFVLTLDKLSNIFIAGNTLSSNFPGDKTNALKSTRDLMDGFIIKISNINYNILKTTFIGTTSNDYIYGIKLDENNFVYTMGVTESSNWQVINSLYNIGFGKQFIGKLDNDLTKWIYTTRFGTNSVSPNIAPTAFLVDRCENVYIGGFGSMSTSGTPYQVAGTSNLPVTSDAIQSTTDNKDFYFIVFKRDASQILYATFYGIVNNSDIGDHVDGGTSRFNSDGVIYEAICANCGALSGYPTTSRAVYKTNPARDGSRCNMLGVKIDMQLAGINAKLFSSYLGVKNGNNSCKGDAITFTDELAQGETYTWDFGDGFPPITTTVPTITYTYYLSGTFTITLTSYNSKACNLQVISQRQITIDDKKYNPNFSFERDTAQCDILKINFTNTSTNIIAGANYYWDFGDGTNIITKDLKLSHIYPNSGKYTVVMYATDTYCNRNFPVSKDLILTKTVKASFDFPKFVCINNSIDIINNSSTAQTYEWYIDNVLFSNISNPVFLFTEIKTYTIKLILKDSYTCNKIDSFSTIINALESPIPDFTYIFETSFNNNEIPKFTNTSKTFANKYVWDFGDGKTLTTLKTDTPFYHFYNESKKYNVCLTAYNNACNKSICKILNLSVYPSVVAPNAFTPNNDGINDLFFVKIIGAKFATIKIINRWGQLVYESNNLEEGWNGNFQGAPQLMDMYTYIVDFETYDGQKLNSKGSFTLIR